MASGLTLLFLDETRKQNSGDKVEAKSAKQVKDEEKQREEKACLATMSMKNAQEGVLGTSSIIPLHYPSYTKEDYNDMPEWLLDRLLAEYGLFPAGNLACKRKFAIDAFVWPDSGSSA